MFNLIFIRLIYFKNYDYFGDTMADIAEAAEKKLKSRIRKLKKCNKDEEEKEKFFNQLGLSFTISLPTKNPEKQEDFVMLYTSPDGNIVHAEYAYSEGEEFTQMDISEKDLKVIIESFSDFELSLLD